MQRAELGLEARRGHLDAGVAVPAGRESPRRSAPRRFIGRGLSTRVSPRNDGIYRVLPYVSRDNAAARVGMRAAAAVAGQPQQSSRRGCRLQALAAAFISVTAAITSSATFFGTGS